LREYREKTREREKNAHITHTHEQREEKTHAPVLEPHVAASLRPPGPDGRSQVFLFDQQRVDSVREQPLRLVRAQREKKFVFVVFFFAALQTTFATTTSATTTRRRRRLCLLEQNLKRTQQEGENDEESRRDDAHLRVTSFGSRARCLCALENFCGETREQREYFFR
jgi:hypothetical protein